MARLITKFKYLKNAEVKKIGGYAKYIATREGVEKIDESFKLVPATLKQQDIIKKLLRDFPDAKDMHECDDYCKEPTKWNASEFISRVVEDNIETAMGKKTYADYIATRPRAERFGSHGLFTDDGEPVNLNSVSKELNEYEGNVWTVILSLRREDAQRLGYDNGSRWRDMLRSEAATLAENFKIPLENLRWYGAFHNEGHHPHVHMIVYSKDQKQGYLTKMGVHNMRSAFATNIFAQDLLSVYEKQTQHRDELRGAGKELIAEIVKRINEEGYDNPQLEQKLVRLAKRLSKTKGKKVYGYLKPDVKALICSIVDGLASDERIAKLYELWYEQREEVIKTYTREMEERVPLSRNKEFKSIRNAVIREAMNILLEREALDKGEGDDEDALALKQKKRMWELYRRAKGMLDKDSIEYAPSKAAEFLFESAELGNATAEYLYGKMLYYGDGVDKNAEKALEYLERAAKNGNTRAAYLAGKIRLTEEGLKDIDKAIGHFERAAEDGNDFAEYQLARIYLYGLGAERDADKAMVYLHSAAEKGNEYAKQTLENIRQNRDRYMATGIVRLFYYLSRILRDDLKEGKRGMTDRKELQRINEKKRAHGLKQE